MTATLPFGLWPSPLSPSAMSQSLRLSDVQWTRDNSTLVWLEGRSAHNILVSMANNDAPRDRTSAHNVRAMVGYGGGDYTVGSENVVYVHTDGRLYSQPLGTGAAKALTPGFGHAASPSLSPDERFLMYVHSYEDNDVLALLDLQGEGWPVKLASGSDFFMQPVWHPSGRWVAWVEWDHPQMPWDGTRLCLLELKDGAPCGEKIMVMGGPETPVFQPEFSPDGRHLSVISLGASEDRLLAWTMDEEGLQGSPQTLVQGGILSEAAWVQGMRTYVWHSTGRKLFFRRSENGFASLWEFDLDLGQSQNLTLPHGCHWFSQLSINPLNNELAIIASGPTRPTAIWVGDGHHWRPRRYSESGSIPEEALSSPEPLTWEAEDGSPVHGLYYPPTHPDMKGKGLPPVIVGVHGGPTAQRVASWSPAVAFFTSRGYGFLEVNYRGSFGYGKQYVDALKGRWGEVDVLDTVSGAKMLVDRGLADPERLVVMGGSAGVYTVLNCLVHHPGVFKAGVCLFGVSNLFTIVSDTHKFESRYVDMLVGTLPEARKLFHAWSPVFHAHQINDSLAIFQGRDDKVVPLSQSDSVVEALRSNRIPHHYTVFDGEGHGWRKKETIEQYYKELLRFLRQHVLFA